MSTKKVFLLRKERNFGQRVEATFEFIRVTLKPLFKSMLFYTGPFVLVGMFIVANLLTKLFSMADNSTSGVFASETDILSLGFSLIGFMFLMLFAGAMVMAVVYGTMRVYDELGNNDFTHREVWKKVARIYWPIFGTMFLYGIIFFVIYLIVMVPMVLIMAALSFLAIPVIYIIMSFFMVVMFTALGSQIFERKSIGNAISHAFSVLKGNWWASLGLLIVLMVIYNSVTLIFSAPFYVNFVIQSFNQVDIDLMLDPPLWQQLLQYLLGAILLLGSFFSYCIPLVGMNINFFSIVEKRDARSLISRIDQFGAKPEEEEESY